jgi:predicted nucleic acid-binding protein
VPDPSSTCIVLDSSFLVAFYNSRDAHHDRALSAMRSLASNAWGRALLPEYVFLEVVTVLAARRDHESAIHAGDVLLGNRELEFVPCSEIFLAAFDSFRKYDGLSFADAAILAIAYQRSASVLTFDADFQRIKGLEVLP